MGGVWQVDAFLAARPAQALHNGRREGGVLTQFPPWVVFAQARSAQEGVLCAQLVAAVTVASVRESRNLVIAYQGGMSML